MVWIGLIFTVIIIFNWFEQRKQQADLKKRFIVLSITITFLILSELLYAFKDQFNVFQMLEGVL
ncbi:hypothetical protein [Paenibacillus aceti]|uniref:Histidine kinase n=1 Tax=Paenibacillus aceti TaxID=1820010 RepID=A0ABQ1W5X5_9BACL|nr:hypothetical protein [Paenibacillus aceti]GGG13062.1 hypothetical protein GCM10010913_38580 [Paenibacillus aceti]